jgi:hypothetical protein
MVGYRKVDRAYRSFDSLRVGQFGVINLDGEPYVVQRSPAGNILRLWGHLDGRDYQGFYQSHHVDVIPPVALARVRLLTRQEKFALTLAWEFDLTEREKEDGTW